MVAVIILLYPENNEETETSRRLTVKPAAFIINFLRKTHCIGALPIHPRLKMQMVASRVSCAPHKAEHLALLYLLTGSHTDV